MSDLPHSIEPALTVWLFHQGCWGTQEILDFHQPLLEYAPEISQRKIVRVAAYFEDTKRKHVEGRLSNWLKRRSPATKAKWQRRVHRDWLHEWKKHFKSFSLAGLRFCPVWKISKKDVLRKTVIIDPGMAFGTGTHETTQFAIRMLNVLSGRGDFKGRKVLDVGSGSGILSVVAAKLGAGQVVAIDNDPQAWVESRKTFKLNRVRRCKVSRVQISQMKDKYDVVAANIIDGILINLRSHLWARTKPGGFLVLSGILTSGANAFIRDFLEGTTGRVIKRISDPEWTSFLISK